MSGVLFIINVPRKDHEEQMSKREKTAKIIIEKDKYERASRVIDELKVNKKFGSLKIGSETYASNDENIITKCKSTDCLHKGNTDHCLYKSKSENILDDSSPSMGSNQSYVKTSWEEIKQVIRPRRTKLQITRPGSEDLLAAFHWDTPLETILSEIISRLNIKNAAWNPSRNERFWHVLFSLESGSLCEELLQVLRTFGIGSRHQSSISVIPCALYYKSSNGDASMDIDQEKMQSVEISAWSRFSSSVRARTNLAQVLHDVRTEAALTFDWLFLLIVAAFVAAIGLVENSTVILVASMLISPLMGPITAGTLGTAVRDRSLQQMGVTHELLGLFLSLIIGFIFGLAICAVDERYGVGDWPTNEMMSRCEIRSLWVGVLVAIPSGACVALAVLGEYTASLVGVAISASLLPPAVNAVSMGLLWAMALVHLIYMDDATRWNGVVKTIQYSTNQPTELAVLGTVSLCLTLVNIICIFVAGVAVYKVKEVCPLDRKDITWWRSNRSMIQKTQNSQPNQCSNIAWDMYSKWCDEEEMTKEAQVKAEITSVQSDTVTYRRPHRIRKENIYAHNHRKTTVTKSYMPLDPPKTNLPKDEGTEDDDMGIESNLESNSSDYMESTLNIVDKDFPCHNLGFGKSEDGNNNDDNTRKDYPTLEPSLSYTIDPKKYGVVLNSKSYNV